MSEYLEFAGIADAVKLIDDGSQRQVFIPFDETAREIERALRNGMKSRELMRKAGAYMVNIRSNDFEQLLAVAAVHNLDDELSILVDNSFYSDKVGIVIPDAEGLTIIL